MIKRVGLAADQWGGVSIGVLALSMLLGGCWDTTSREVFTLGQYEGNSDPRGVGDACIPEDEDFVDFSGFSLGEINISTEDARCSSGTCLVNRFQGRASCPEGNLDRGECFTPSGELVSVDVRPHLPDRSAEEAVHCSCRCDGPAPFRPFCECPGDMVCEELVSWRGVAPSEDRGQGSYCVRR